MTKFEELDDNVLELLEDIARKEMNIPSLETHNSDSDDFYTVAVWSLLAALQRAYEAGRTTEFNKVSQFKKRLDAISNAFWTDGESDSVKVEDLQEFARLRDNPVNSAASLSDPPCDCIVKLNECFVQECDCHDRGCLAEAQNWCSKANTITKEASDTVSNAFWTN